MLLRRILAGQKFGCYTVLDDHISKPANNGTRIFWKCRCDCGYEQYIESYAIQHKKNKYCQMCRQPGIRNEKLYHILYGMIARCENKNNPRYYLYGGKGVSVCDEWKNDYQVFKRWSYENGYTPDAELSIDRINSDGDYEPNNCQWIPVSENSAKANYGRVKSYSKLSDIYAISPDGQKITIDNIAAFQREHNEITLPSLHAILNGRMPAKHKGWTFHSNKTRPLEV